LGGNIANASPAGDTIPPLLICDAELLLQSQDEERIVTLEDFVVGPGETQLKSGEFINNISFSTLSGSWGSAFLKVGKRLGMSISVVNGAAVILLDENGLINDVRIALGAVGPKVIRCRKTEKFLQGKEPSAALLKEVSTRWNSISSWRCIGYISSQCSPVAGLNTANSLCCLC